MALPDAAGRRDILSIHTRAMRANGALAADGAAYCDDVDGGLPARTEHFSGAELAGLVRSAASFALGRTAIGGDDALPPSVAREDFERARAEISPALGKQDEALARRFGRHGVASDAHASVRRAFERVVAAGAAAPAAAVRSALLAGDVDGAGCTALASWAAAIASSGGHADYVRMTTAVDLLRDGGSEAARATALADRFAEARGMGRALLVLDDVDELCAADSGNGERGAGPSALMVATLRALLREAARRSGHRRRRLVAPRPRHAERRRSAGAAPLLRRGARRARADERRRGRRRAAKGEGGRRRRRRRARGGGGG